MFAFNRPDKAAQVFAAVRAARPPRLFLVCDGPRATHPDDAARCAEVRRVLDAVDWPCEVERDYAESNLGCRRRISSGIAWVFSRVDEAIFLEDDTLPDASFFPYCDELLERYRDDARVFVVGAHNQLQHGGSDGASYWFSAHPRIWGWASWRRAWEGYDASMSAWPAAKAEPAWTTRTAQERQVWGEFFDHVRAGTVDTWDAQATLHAWRTGALTAIPRTNLVSNIGFGADSTNTRSETSVTPPVRALEWPLVHPREVRRDAALDAEWIAGDLPRRPGLLRRVLRRLRRAMRGGA